MDNIVRLKEYIKQSRNPILNLFANLYVHHLYFFVRTLFQQSSVPIFYICKLFPLQNKIVATTFSGRKYGDNPQPILEEIYHADSSIKIIWLKDNSFHYTTPEYVKVIPFHNYWRKAYEMATAKVWISSHNIEHHIRKRKKQTFIETWHGGLGVKKVKNDLKDYKASKYSVKETQNTVKCADLFISNSNHLTRIYRKAFLYCGDIWQVGYPKNDILFQKDQKKHCGEKVRAKFTLEADSKILIYAPTFRDNFFRHGLQKELYQFCYKQIAVSLKEKFGGKWYIFIRHHPIMKQYRDILFDKQEGVIDATDYDDSQELILAADAFISDYSSMIFDAAMTGIPCFTFARDYLGYKNNRGLYYNLENLPFPFATNEDELTHNISSFDFENYKAKWDAFKKEMGLIETDCSAKKIANLIIDILQNGKNVIQKHIQNN